MRHTQSKAFFRSLFLFLLTFAAAACSSDTGTGSISLHAHFPDRVRLVGATPPGFAPAAVDNALSIDTIRISALDHGATVSSADFPAAAREGLISIPSGAYTVKVEGLIAGQVVVHAHKDGIQVDAGKFTDAGDFNLAPINPLAPSLTWFGYDITRSATLVLNGTKDMFTGITINGQTIVEPDALTTFKTTVTLKEGANTLPVISFTAENDQSSVVTLKMTLDTVAPVAKSFALLGNATAVSTTTAHLVAAADGATEMNVATDAAFSNGTWVTFDPAIDVDLPAVDNSYSFFIKFRDRAGNESDVLQTTFSLDRVGPTGTTVSLPGNPAAVSTTTVTFNLAAIGASEMLISTDGKVDSETWMPFANTAQAALPSGDGAKSITVLFRDAAGNVTQVLSSVNLDTQGPLGTSVQVTGNPVAVNSNLISLTLATGGATEMQLSEDSAFSGAVWSPAATSTTFLTSLFDGTKTIYARFRDAAGNASLKVAVTVTVDTSVPTGTMQISGAPTDVSAATVTLNFSSAKATEMMVSESPVFLGASWVTYTASAPFTLSGGDGSKTVYVQFRNAAGTLSSTSSASVNLDTTPPSGISVAVNGAPSSVSTTTISLDLAATGAVMMQLSEDAGFSGATWIPFSSSQAFNLSGGDGAKTVYARFRDAIDNTSGSTSTGVTLLSVAPTGLSIYMASAFTTQVSQTLTLTAIGATEMQLSEASDFSGAAWQAYAATVPFTIGATPGLHTIYFRARGASLVTSAAVTSSITLDTTAPAVALLQPSGPYASGAALSVDGTMSDPDSGIADLTVTFTGPFSGAVCSGVTGISFTCPWDTTLVTDGVYTLHVVTTNGAGVTAATSQIVTVDNTAPSVVFTGFQPLSPYAYWDGISSQLVINGGQSGTFDALFTATDTNGILQVDFPNLGSGYTPAGGTDATPEAVNLYRLTYGFSSAPGSGLLSATATDSAGNVQTAAFETIADTSGPLGGTLTYAAGATSDNSVSLIFTTGTDDFTSVFEWKIERRYASTCAGPFGAWSQVGVTSPTSPMLDALPTDGCYEYQLGVLDQVQNSSVIAPGLQRELQVAPAPAPGATLFESSPTSATILNITLTQTGSPASMQISEDPSFTGAPVLPYATSATFARSGGDGAKTIYVRTLDGFSTPSASAILGVTIDETAPSVSLFEITGNPIAVNYVSLSLGLSVTDAYPVEMFVTEDPAYTSGAWEPFSGAKAFSISAGDGVKNIYAKFRDTAGNVSFASPISVMLDTLAPAPDVTAPTNAQVLVNGISTLWGSTDGVVGQGGFVSLYLQDPNGNYFDGISWTPGAANVPANTIGAGVSERWYFDTPAFLISGTYAVWVNATDAAANSGSGTTVPFVVDLDAPVITSFDINGGVTDTTTALVTVNVAVTDLTATEMQVSDSPGFAGATWVPVGSVSHTLTSGDGSNTVYVRVRDAAGNISSDFRTINLDTTPPTASFFAYTETSPYIWDQGGSILWVNPYVAETFDVEISASDLSGIANVVFPDLGTNWSPPGGGLIATAPYVFTYSSTPTASYPGTVTATAYDNNGLSADVSFTIKTDSLPPFGATINYADGFTNTPTVTIALTPGTDNESGLDYWQVERSFATLTNGICGAYGAWGNVGPASTASPYNDVAPGDGCYQYRLSLFDHTFNQASYITPSVVKLDTLAPTGETVSLAGAPLAVSSPSVTVQLGATDAFEYELSEDPGFAGATWYAMAATAPFTLSGGDGPKTVFARYRDEAGNQTAPVSVSVDLDTVPATVTVADIAAGAAAINVTQTTLATVASPDAYEMMLTGDVVSPRGWVPYTPSLNIVLGDRSGNEVVDFNGGADVAFGIVQQPDGKLIIAGNGSNGSDADFAVVRLNQDGSPDTTFNATGTLLVDIGAFGNYGYAVTLQADGKIVVAGSSGSANTDISVIRVNPNGTLDTSFDTDGIATASVGAGNDGASAVAVDASGNIVVAGYTFNTTYDIAVVRFDTNGALDTTFNATGMVTTAIGSGSDQANTLLIQPDGQIVVGGHSVIGLYDSFALVRYNTNGSLDTSFGGGAGYVTTAIGAGNSVLYALTLQGDGTFLAVGQSNNGTNNDMAVAKYDATGALVTSFNGTGILTLDLGGSEEAHGIAVLADGSLLLGGQMYNTTFDLAFVNITAAGVLNSAWGQGGKVAVDFAGSTDTAKAMLFDGKTATLVGSALTVNDDFSAARIFTETGETDTGFGGMAEGSKTVTVKVRDAALQGTGSASDTIVFDVTPPITPIFSVLGSPAAVSSPILSLSISTAGATEMIFSEDPAFAGASWEPFSNSGNYTLTGGDGNATIYAKVRDLSGNETVPVSTSVILDTLAPLAGIVNDGPGADLSVQIALTSMDANWNGFSDGGGSGLEHYEWAVGTSPGAADVLGFQYAALATAVASGASLSVGTTYFVTVRAFDNAGNVTTVSSDGVMVVPNISSGLSPASGGAFDQVDIIGANFGATQNTSTVWFGGAAATVISWSDTYVQAWVPTDLPAGVYNVKINVNGADSNTQPFTLLAPTHFVFGSVPLTLTAGQCSTGTIDMFAEDDGAFMRGVTQNTAVTLNAPNLLLYTDPGCSTGLISSPVTLPAGQSSISVYAYAEIVGSQSLDVSAPGITLASQSQTVNPGAATNLVFTGVPASVVAGVCSTAIQVQSRDAFNNISNLAGSATVTFAGTGSGTFYSDNSCTGGNELPSALISGGTSSVTVYFKDPVQENLTLSASDGVLTPASAPLSIIPPAPTLSGATPNTGPIGALVTLSGSNFGASQGGSTVTVGGQTAAVQSWSPSTIVIWIPGGISLSLQTITVTTAGGPGSTTFSVTPNPAISNVSPGFGSAGTSVNVNGSYFGSVQGTGFVHFTNQQNGGIFADAAVNTWSDTVISVIVPALPDGNYDVTVNNAGVSGAPSPFHIGITAFIASLTPPNGPPNTVITLNGGNFGASQGVSQVMFGNVTAAVTSWGNSQIVLNAPLWGAPGTQAVSVVTTQTSNPMPFEHYKPVIDQRYPASGTTGTNITLVGRYFGGASGTAKIGLVAANIMGWTPTTVQIQVNPGTPSGTLPVTVTTQSGDVSLATLYTQRGPDVWLPTNGEVPDARTQHSAVWTGSEMIIWGGKGATVYNSGARYNPATDSWAGMTPAPISARYDHTAVWTGKEMIVWGGQNPTQLGDGARYDPNKDAWQMISATGAPNARAFHTAVWTGKFMVIYGGDESGVSVNTGGRYDPKTDTWSSLSTGANALAVREQHTAVWANGRMIVWGGTNIGNSTYYADGAKYDPESDLWYPMAATAMAGRMMHTAVWTGQEMIVWGGTGAVNYNDGGRYSPAADVWKPVSTGANVPTARNAHLAVWSGSEMLIFGGFDGSYVSTGARYDAKADTWAAMQTTPMLGRFHASGVWDGKELVVWGGANGPAPQGDGSRYDPVGNTWAPTVAPDVNLPVARSKQTATWTGSQMVVFGGVANSNPLGAGGRYTPATDTWLPISASGAPAARSGHSATWTGTYVVIFGGQTIVGGPAQTSGSRYNPATDSWLTLSPPSTARANHYAVWYGNKVFIGGGYNGTGLYFNTTDLYDPGTNSWTAGTTMTNTRADSTAVVVNGEIVVWGGYNGTTLAALEYWNGTVWGSTAGGSAPTGRRYHTAVSTASNKMIVWGGFDGLNNKADGGVLDVTNHTWTLTAASPLGARIGHTALSTGNAMIVWGGENNGAFYNDGAFYDPGLDQWKTLTGMTPYLPAQRSYHSAVWTGSEMLIWGGAQGNGKEFSSAGRYIP